MKILLLIFTLCLISDGGTSKEVTGYSGGGVLIKCKYHPEYSQNKKYFCKGSSPGCSDQIRTGNKNMWVTSGRFSLFDDTKSSEFRVMIRNLTVDDTGTYQCGVDKFLLDIYTPVKLKVNEGISGFREVRTYTGGGINIKCGYEDEYKDKLKSFYKIGTHQQRFTPITTTLNSGWSHDGRFSIHDNRNVGFFSVMIRDVKMEDTGTYSCAVRVSDEIETYTVVKLNVGEDLFYEKIISKTLHVGGDLNISCKYPQSLRSNPKFLCSVLTPGVCVYKESVTESIKEVKLGKFSLYDDRTEEMLSVRIRNVTETDSGEFWCGAEAAWTSDHGYKLYFTQIKLIVTVSASKPTQPTLISSSSSITSSPSSSSPSSSSPSSSSPSPASSSSSSKPTTASSAGFSASSMITVSVILLLLLIGISVLTMSLRKRHKIKEAATSRSSVKNTGNTTGVPLDDCHYEEIKDIRTFPLSDTDTSTVYCTAHLPTILSDPSQTIYANPDLQTIPSDSALYSTAQLPIKPEQDIYSTAQLPTAQESTPGPIYAAVSFHTKSTKSNDAVTKIVFKK